MRKRTAPQRYASCILRLAELTPHQKEKVQELFDADEVRNGLEKRLGRFVLFVPSLSWQVIAFSHMKAQEEVSLHVMSGAEPPHQGGGRHGQDFRCANATHRALFIAILVYNLYQFLSGFRRNERPFAKTGSGQARKGNVPLKKKSVFMFFLCLCVCLAQYSGDDLSAREGKKTQHIFYDPFILKMPSFYQDRLGTNIGNALQHKREMRFENRSERLSPPPKVPAIKRRAEGGAAAAAGGGCWWWRRTTAWSTASSSG
eukprot:COSAG06_NODE_519_length_14752_cov_130.649840_4_plen_258_part_00